MKRRKIKEKERKRNKRLNKKKKKEKRGLKNGTFTLIWLCWSR